jgi:chromosome segregation ATPase
MESITEMKKYIATLVETNRALASDLDSSRRVAATLGHQRDSLELEVARLRSDLDASAMAGGPDHWRREAEQLREELAEQKRELGQLRRERDERLRNAERDQARMRRAEERITSLTAALGRTEEERDVAQSQLEEAMDALDEIRCSVQGSLEDAVRAAEPGAVQWD